MLRLLHRLLRLVVRRPAPAGAAPPRVARRGTTLAGLAAAAGAAVFGGLGWLVGQGALVGPDLAVSLGVQRTAPPLLLDALAAVSRLGSWPLNALAVAGAMAAFALSGLRVEALFAGLAALGTAGLGVGLKLLWLRPRPAEGTVRVLGSATGTSFPSGHTLFYVGFFGFLFYWCYAFLPKGRRRAALLWLFALLIALIGPARVYLGHHWASDVLAAYALGFAYLFVLIRLYGAVRLRRATTLRPAVGGRRRGPPVPWPA